MSSSRRFGGPAQPSPTIAQCLNGGYGWLEVKCRRCETRQQAGLEAEGGAEMLVVPNAAVLAASTFDQAD
jgi:hypothetical protein